jgi:hypothetical protein
VIKETLSSLVVSIGLLAACAFAGDRELQTGRVRGVEFTADANGFHSVVPGAKVFLIGPATRAAADATGKYVFNALPPGSYNLTAQAPGMIATQTVFVAAGTVSEALLEMKVEAVAQSTTVTASADAAGAQEATGTNTVGESAVRDMPNTNERFESLLPLIPGVVRGPDGLINMKGARSSQNGSLVNNADVTDPATGEMMLWQK